MNSRSAKATAWIAGLHDETTALFTQLDGGGAFTEDRWMREGGGGGVSRVLTEGQTFEKVGVNRSAVYGSLARDVAQRLGGHVNADAETAFFATGLSIVAHPRSPRVPTVHLNVRYFEITDSDNNVIDAWFGGGTDLTPTYPDPALPRFFHRTLQAACDRHHSTLYARFKPWCDQYFRNTHRGGEARGVGGVFFDHVRPFEDESGLSDTALFAFAGDIAGALGSAYAPIVNSQRNVATNDEERSLQPHTTRTLCRIQLAARPWHAVWIADRRACGKCAHEFAAAGQVGVYARRISQRIEQTADRDVGAARLGD